MKSSKPKMSFEDFELAYAALAEAIDKAGEAQEALFLTKLSLLLAHELGDISAFRQAITEAHRDITS